MRRSEIVMELARRHVPLDAGPEVRAAIFREVASAVRAAGQRAEAALMLTERDTGDALVAFTDQVRALEGPPRVPAERVEPAEPTAPKVRRSSWRPETVRFKLPGGL